MVLPELAAHFAAGSYGGVRENQVRVPRVAWKPAGDTESYRVYLEIDDEALEWLSAEEAELQVLHWTVFSSMGTLTSQEIDRTDRSR